MTKAQELLQQMRKLYEFRDSAQKLPSLNIKNEKLDMAISLIRSWLGNIQKMYGYNSMEFNRAKEIVGPIMTLFHSGIFSTVLVGKSINLTYSFPTDMESKFTLSVKVNVGKGLSIGQRRSAKWFAQPLSASGEERVFDAMNYFSNMFLKEINLSFSNSDIPVDIKSSVDYAGEGYYGNIIYSGIIQG